MEKNNMYYNVHQTRIHRNVYRPSHSFISIVQSLLSIILVGKSPIQHRTDYGRRPK